MYFTMAGYSYTRADNMLILFLFYLLDGSSISLLACLDISKPQTNCSHEMRLNHNTGSV